MKAIDEIETPEKAIRPIPENISPEHEDDFNEEEAEEQSLKMIDKMKDTVHMLNQPLKEQTTKEKIQNPISPYMVFQKMWKEQNPTAKFSMKERGEIWRELSRAEKQKYQTEYIKLKEQYDQEVLASQINGEQQQYTKPQYLFPLARVKHILKQDMNNFTPQQEAIACMSLSTEFFGEMLLNQVSKVVQNKQKKKGRIELNDLYATISMKKNLFGFLDCLIDEHLAKNDDKQKSFLQIEEPKTSIKKEKKSHITLEVEQQKNSKKQKTPQNQTRLTNWLM